MNALISQMVGYGDTMGSSRCQFYVGAFYPDAAANDRHGNRRVLLAPRHLRSATIPHASSDTPTPTPSPTPSPLQPPVVYFHQARMAASERPGIGTQLDKNKVKVKLDVIEAKSDGQLEAASWLRAMSFYAYPPERKFAGEIHQMMVAEEELKALKAARLAQSLDIKGEERSACIVALVLSQDLVQLGFSLEEIDGDGRLCVCREDGQSEMVVGTLDVHGVRALPGEVLIGSSSNAAYLANVCTAPFMRRQGVGETLLAAARTKAREWGVDDMYVHTQAVNEIALRFYQSHGFVKEKEESANQAHYRGRCLDGIEGRGRTVLLRDNLLWDVGGPSEGWGSMLGCRKVGEEGA